MKIFLSWAGSEAQQLAIIFKEWLGMVIQVSQPWLSVDIEKGATWDKEIHDGLKDTKIAILFLTKESIDSKYLHYEAGAISNVPDALVCTFLFNIKKSEVKQPLSRFQDTEFNKADVKKLVLTIFKKAHQLSSTTGTEESIVKLFDHLWDDLNTSIKAVKPDTDANQKHKTRSTEDIMEEILDGVRYLRSVQQPQTTTLTTSDSISHFPRKFYSKDDIIEVLFKEYDKGVIKRVDLNDIRLIKEIFFDAAGPNAFINDNIFRSAFRAFIDAVEIL